MAPITVSIPDHVSVLLPRKGGSFIGATSVGGGGGNDGSEMNTATRAGIAFAVIVAVTAIGVVTYVWLVRRKRRRAGEATAARIAKKEMAVRKELAARASAEEDSSVHHYAATRPRTPRGDSLYDAARPRAPPEVWMQRREDEYVFDASRK